MGSSQRLFDATQDRFRRRSQLPIDQVTGQPVYRGMPVPFAARWSAEAGALGPGVHPIAGNWWSAYGQPSDVDDVMEQRDANGILWWRDIPDRQGVGVPQFAQFHTYRHRDCMISRRCQVCGRRFGDDPVTFLVPRQGLPNGGAVRTHNPLPSFTPPTCSACLPTVLRKCPGQRTNPHIFVQADEFAPWRVQADWMQTATGITIQRDQLKLSDPNLRLGVAKQLGVLITRWHEVVDG